MLSFAGSEFSVLSFVEDFSSMIFFVGAFFSFPPNGFQFVLIRALIGLGIITRRHWHLSWTVVPLLGGFVAGLVIDAWLMAFLDTIYSTNAMESHSWINFLFSSFSDASKSRSLLFSNCNSSISLVELLESFSGTHKPSPRPSINAAPPDVSRGHHSPVAEPFRFFWY